MATKISGADLQPGTTFKHPAHNRIYTVVDIADSGNLGDRLGRFRQSDGHVVEFSVFDDSQYDLRGTMPGDCHRMVKVRAADLELMLSLLSEATPVPEESAAINRLREALR
jgi:hypothetical protein